MKYKGGYSPSYLADPVRPRPLQGWLCLTNNLVYRRNTHGGPRGMFKAPGEVPLRFLCTPRAFIRAAASRASRSPDRLIF